MKSKAQISKEKRSTLTKAQEVRFQQEFKRANKIVENTRMK
ncbi:YfhE family protein [Halobacillus aidingensis]|uniref:YfhE-like protein n=1 Tax=Halobacillus aidingensis TaxID=240303 RepID=A0A1H0IWU2_HALAD|nr:YfhE family protein [Halobacillus aidingensis]SDO35709.1 YfhE-like protein [Halobacillus aidingensis]